MIQKRFLHLLREVYEKTMNLGETTPQKLAIDIQGRSRCAVMVGAVIADRHGIFAWGWNHEGLGTGMHAEHHAINRANRRRMEGASIYVAGLRRRNHKIVNSRPCEGCLKLIREAGISRIYWMDDTGNWSMERVRRDD